MRHYNRKEKTANWLFKIAEYVTVALLINALLPNTPLNIRNVLVGVVILVLLFILALWITPEKEEKK